MLEEQLIPRALYGGALEMDIPVRFEDISEFRPVPDHQEVRLCSCLSKRQFRAGAISASLAGLDGRFLRPITCAGNRGEPNPSCVCVYMTCRDLQRNSCLRPQEHQAVSDQECMELYFKDLAEQNQAISHQILNKRKPSAV